MANNSNNTFDFGFSIIDEDELRKYEKELEATNAQVTLSVDQYKTKLRDLHAMIMVLMNNLSKEPSKSYIYWPNRQPKINEFIRKINDIVDN